MCMERMANYFNRFSLQSVDVIVYAKDGQEIKPAGKLKGWIKHVESIGLSRVDAKVYTEIVDFPDALRVSFEV